MWAVDNKELLRSNANFVSGSSSVTSPKMVYSPSYGFTHLISAPSCNASHPHQHNEHLPSAHSFYMAIIWGPSLQGCFWRPIIAISTDKVTWPLVQSSSHSAVSDYEAKTEYIPQEKLRSPSMYILCRQSGCFKTISFAFWPSIRIAFPPTEGIICSEILPIISVSKYTSISIKQYWNSVS